MVNNECGFCKLISNLSSERSNLKIVYESDNVLAFHSIRPFAEVHVIVISKRHIPTIFDFTDTDDGLKLEMMSAVKIASEEVISLKGACKVEMYLGSFQQAPHFHCHVIYDSKID